MGVMVEGARCWNDEVEKPIFSSAVVPANHVHAGLVCKIPGYTAHLERKVQRNGFFRCVYTREECGQTRSRLAVLLHIEDNQRIDAPAGVFWSIPAASVLKTQTL